MPANQDPVCPKCGRVMTVLQVGVEAVYMAHEPPRPYEVRSGDLCGCDRCGARVLTKWANTSLMEFAGKRFEDRVMLAFGAGRVVPVWEHWQDAAQYAPLEDLLEAWLAERAEARKAAAT